MVCIKTEYNSMSLVRRDCRRAASSSSSSYVRKRKRKKKGRRERTRTSLHVTLNGWDVALFSPLSLTLCPLEWMTCERPHARTHHRITHIWIDTHTHKHTDSEKERERKNLCICLKTLTAASFYTRTLCVYVIHRNSYIFFGRLFSVRRKYYPCHHIFQLDVRRLSESMRNRLMERRETFHYISTDGLSLLLSLCWVGSSRTCVAPICISNLAHTAPNIPPKKSDWHIWPLRNDLIVHCPSIFISIRNGC